MEKNKYKKNFVKMKKKNPFIIRLNKIPIPISWGYF